MKNFPKQRVSYTKKTENDYQWCRDTMDYLLLNFGVDKDVVNAYQSIYDKKLANYRLFNNQLDQADFERECNPLGLEIGQYKDEIQPYNKTYNKIQTLLEEEARMPWEYKAVLVNPDGIRSKMAHKDVLFHNYVNFQIQQVLTQLGLEFEQDSYNPDELIDPREIDSYMNTSYLDGREHLASMILKVLVKELSLKDVKVDAYKHGLISGEEVVWVGEENDEPVVRAINSLGFFAHKSPEQKYIQNGLFAGYRTYMHSGDILDEFGRFLKEEDAQRIDSNHQGFMGIHQSHINPDMRYFHDNYYYLNQLNAPFHEGSYSTSTEWGRDWLVQHIEWRSQKKVGFISFTNEYGDPEKDMVSEDFELPRNAKRYTEVKEYGRKCIYYSWNDLNGIEYKLEWGWIPEVWTGVRIGSDIYCMMGPKKHQFRSLDNPFDVKLGYHGLAYSSMNAEPISLMDRMKPFQYLYFIIMHKLKKLIAQDKGRVFHFDVSMVDPKIGLDKTLYYLTNMGVEFFNPLQNAMEPGTSQRGKVTTSTDWSTTAQINNYINILAAIDQQISDVGGVTKEREGQIGTDAAVSNTQTSIQMSTSVTGIYLRSHNKLWEHILTSLVDVTQSCWKNKSSITKQVVLDDLSTYTLNFTPDALTNASFGIYVVNSPKENDIFRTLREWGMALLQTEKATFSNIIDMLDGESIQTLKRQIKQSEQEAIQREQQAQQAQIEGQMQIQREQQEFLREMKQMELDNKIEVAQINSFARQMDQDQDDNGIPDQFELMKFEQEVKLKERKLRLDEKKLQQDGEIKRAQIKAKRATSK